MTKLMVYYVYISPSAHFFAFLLAFFCFCVVYMTFFSSSFHSLSLSYVYYFAPEKSAILLFIFMIIKKNAIYDVLTALTKIVQ